MASRRTVSRRAAAAIIFGRKNAGYQSVTTTQALAASVGSRSRPWPARGFDIRIVERPTPSRVPPVDGHAVEDELMQPVVRARVVAPQRLEDHQRLPQGDGVIDRPLQPEVPA